MTQVLEKPPATAQTTGQRFCLLTRHHSPLLYWQGSAWSDSASSAKAFPSYELAHQERPLAVKKAPAGASVVISQL